MAISVTYEIIKDINATFSSDVNPSFAELPGGAGFAYIADRAATFEDGFIYDNATGDSTSIVADSEASSRSIAALNGGNLVLAGNFGDDILYLIANGSGVVFDGGVINSSSVTSYGDADVTGLANGGFAIAYIADFGSETDPRINFFDAAGVQTSSVIIDSDTFVSASGIKVATLSNGNVVAAWTDEINATGETEVVFAI